MTDVRMNPATSEPRRGVFTFMPCPALFWLCMSPSLFSVAWFAILLGSWNEQIARLNLFMAIMWGPSLLLWLFLMALVYAPFALRAATTKPKMPRPPATRRQRRLGSALALLMIAPMGVPACGILTSRLAADAPPPTATEQAAQRATLDSWKRMVGEDVMVTPLRGKPFQARLIKVKEFSLRAGHLHLQRPGKKLEGKGFGAIRSITLAQPVPAEAPKPEGAPSEDGGQEEK